MKEEEKIRIVKASDRIRSISTASYRCYDCNTHGKRYDHKHTLIDDRGLKYETCETCNGKGFVCHIVSDSKGWLKMGPREIN